MNKFENSLDIAGRIGLGNLSKQSISRRLSNAGIHSRIAAIKDILSDEHRACRLHFTRRYVNYPLEYWNFGSGWFSRTRNRGRQHRTAKYEFVDYEMKDSLGKTFIPSSELGERRSVFGVGCGWVD